MWQKRCVVMVTSCGMTRTSHCALYLRARAGHMNNTNAHTSIHNPCGIAGVRSSTITIQLFHEQFSAKTTVQTNTWMNHDCSKIPIR
jgi:hypothetical protein